MTDTRNVLLVVFLAGVMTGFALGYQPPPVEHSPQPAKVIDHGTRLG